MGVRDAPVRTADAGPPEGAEAPEATQASAMSGRRRWAVFAVVGTALLMISIDQTSVATALSALQDDLGVGLAWASWTITVYAVGQILVLPVAGALGDRFGSRRVFLVGVALFTAMSVLCGVASGAPELIAFRLLQGLAGGALMPSATGIVAHAFGRERDRAIALFTSVFPVGAVLGPLVGGLVLTVWSWRGIFLVNLPVGIVLLVVGALLIRPGTRGEAAPVDLGGIAWLCAVLLSGMVAVARLGALGTGWWGPLSVAGPALVAGLAAVCFVRHLHRHPNPVVPPRLLTGGSLGTLNLTNVCFGAAVFGFSALVPHYAQIRYGIAPLAAGALLTARAVGMIATSGIAVALLRRLGHRPLMVAGMSAMALAMVMTAVPPPLLGPEAWLTVASALVGLGMGLAAPAANNAGLHLVPEQASAAAGLRAMFRQTGGITVVSVITAVMTASSAPALANAVAFAVLAGFVVVAVVLGARVPNQRGRW